MRKNLNSKALLEDLLNGQAYFYVMNIDLPDKKIKPEVNYHEVIGYKMNPEHTKLTIKLSNYSTLTSVTYEESKIELDITEDKEKELQDFMNKVEEEIFKNYKRYNIKAAEYRIYRVGKVKSTLNIKLTFD